MPRSVLLSRSLCFWIHLELQLCQYGHSIHVPTGPVVDWPMTKLSEVSCLSHSVCLIVQCFCFLLSGRCNTKTFTLRANRHMSTHLPLPQTSCLWSSSSFPARSLTRCPGLWMLPGIRVYAQCRIIILPNKVANKVIPLTRLPIGEKFPSSSAKAIPECGSKAAALHFWFSLMY